MVFPVVMNGCESWTTRKAEHWRIDAFEPWCWRRLLRVSWTARRWNQFILKEINSNIHWKDGCWSWSYNTLATWCEELTHWKRLWCWERLRAEEGDNRGWDGWMACIIDSMDMSLSKIWEIMKYREACCAALHGVAQSQTRLGNWTATIYTELGIVPYSKKTSQPNNTRTTALSNSMNQAMPAGQPKMGGSRWRGLTECGPLEKGMASHFSILALRTPWTVWKGKMIGYQKRNSPGH